MLLLIINDFCLNLLTKCHSLLCLLWAMFRTSKRMSQDLSSHTDLSHSVPSQPVSITNPDTNH